MVFSQNILTPLFRFGVRSEKIWGQVLKDLGSGLEI
jgi:hypothetical protein